MDELFRLFPRKIAAAVVGAFLLGIAGLVLLVRLTPTLRTVVFLVFGAGMIVLLVGATGLLLLARQSEGLDKQRDAGG